jgi:hypothetical protein
MKRYAGKVLLGGSALGGMARSQVSRYGAGNSTQVHFGNVLANFDKLFAAIIVKRVIFGCSCSFLGSRQGSIHEWHAEYQLYLLGLIELEHSLVIIKFDTPLLCDSRKTVTCSNGSASIGVQRSTVPRGHR